MNNLCIVDQTKLLRVLSGWNMSLCRWRVTWNYVYSPLNRYIDEILTRKIKNQLRKERRFSLILKNIGFEDYNFSSISENIAIGRFRQISVSVDFGKYLIWSNLT